MNTLRECSNCNIELTKDNSTGTSKSRKCNDCKINYRSRKSNSNMRDTSESIIQDDTNKPKPMIQILKGIIIEKNYQVLQKIIS